MQFYNHRSFLLVSIFAIAAHLPAQEAHISRPERVTLAQAVQRALASDPRLPLQDFLVEAAEGHIEQAGLPPNPVIGGAVENVFGSGPFEGVDGLEVTLGISQTIETAGKRARRTDFARAERRLVDWDREIVLAGIEEDVRLAFVEVLLAQQLVELRGEQLTLAERGARETEQLVEAARSPEVDATRARLAVRRHMLTLRQAERDLESAKTVLASYWGDAPTIDFSVIGEVEFEGATPPFAQLASALMRSAPLARYEAEAQVREAAVDLEQARSKPDFDVFGGVRYFNEGAGEAAFVVGIEVPWPLFDKNQGNIRAARARRGAVTHAKEATRRQLLIELNQAYQDLVNARTDAQSIRADLMPAAEQTLEESQKAYEQGRFTLLAVLDSRASLFEIREAYLDALSRYALSQSKIQALTRPAAIQN